MIHFTVDEQRNYPKLTEFQYLVLHGSSLITCNNIATNFLVKTRRWFSFLISDSHGC